jgi:predicted TIM-barrel fold metal-dependent hydrolase
MFGTDFPFRPGSEAVEGLANYDLPAAGLAAIESDNAKKLLPQLKT